MVKTPKKSSERDRAETEQRILNAAISVWSKYGFHGSPVTMIAEEAGANVSLINRYFGGKEGLLLEVVERTILEKQTGKLDYAPKSTLKDEVLAYLRFRYSKDVEMLSFLRVIISEITINKTFRNKALKSLTYGADDNFIDRITLLKKDGKIKKELSPDNLFRIISLFSFSSFYVEKALLDIDQQKTDALLIELADMIALRFGTNN